MRSVEVTTITPSGAYTEDLTKAGGFPHLGAKVRSWFSLFNSNSMGVPASRGFREAGGKTSGSGKAPPFDSAQGRLSRKEREKWGTPHATPTHRKQRDEWGTRRRTRLPSTTPQPAAFSAGSIWSALVSASFIVHVGRTLLSAAFGVDVGVDSDLPRTPPKIKTKSNGKGGGQECPPYTRK